jgi:hypothetical protein
MCTGRGDVETMLPVVEETMDAMRKAGDIKYRPPGT